MDLTPSSSPSLSSSSEQNAHQHQQQANEQQHQQQQQSHHNQQSNIHMSHLNTPNTTNKDKLTPEQEEEMKLRSKYPNPQKPGGSSFIQKMLHKGVIIFHLFLSNKL